MIPKIIHYCWFGGNPLPQLAIKCIDSWKRYCPDYEIKEWNDRNFDIRCNNYVRQAYEAKKYAFVSDYARLFILFNYGGIYMDTDVELLKPIDKFLLHEAFSGFETQEHIPTGIIASVKHHLFFKELLSYYSERQFIQNDGSYDLTTNVLTITDYCVKSGLKLNNTLQNINGFILYPQDYFCPKNYRTGKINLTSNSYAIHHFAGSWQSSYFKSKIVIIRVLGPKITNFVAKAKRKVESFLKRR